MSFLAIPTLAGQAAILAAIDPEDPVPLVISELVVGDGGSAGGTPITPLETMTELVNQRAVVPVSATSRDGNKLTIDAILDETIGGFVITEAGILDENGVLLFVASVPATEKIGESSSVADVLTLGLIVIVSDTANVEISVGGVTYATHDYVNSAFANFRTNIGHPLRPYHIAVKSMALAAPPESPAPGDTYVVAADAIGAWAGHTGKLAQYVGSETWVFVSCPNGHMVGNEADSLLYQRIGGVWSSVMPANAAGWLYNNGSGVKTWSDPFNINGLTARTIAGADELAFHAAAIAGKRKTTVNAFADALAERIAASDYLHSEMFFMGNF